LDKSGLSCVVVVGRSDSIRSGPMGGRHVLFGARTDWRLALLRTSEARHTAMTKNDLSLEVCLEGSVG
jgi:hypothetical protein